MDQLDTECKRRGIDLSINQQERIPYSPEWWMAAFSDTSAMSTPLLMSKIKEHVLHLRTNAAATAVATAVTNCSTAVESSGIGESGFEISENASQDKSSLDAKNRAQAGLSVSTLSIHSTPAPSKAPSTLVTSTVMKKKSVPGAVLEQPIVKCKKTHVFFGGCKVNDSKSFQKRNIVILNPSFQQHLELELLMKDCQDFKIVADDESVVSRLNLLVKPRQECVVNLVFQPRRPGPIDTKLNMYPRCDSSKKLKYTVGLSGYGGGSRIRTATPLLTPKLKGTFWTCQLTLENGGNVPAYTYIQPVHG